MKRILIFILILIPIITLGQAPPPAPPPPVAPSPPSTLQNNTGFVQSQSANSFKPSGSMVKPSPFLAGADMAIIQNPTFEGGFRVGFSVGYAKQSFDGVNSFGANVIATFDITQRAINVFYSRKYKKFKLFTSYSFAQIGKSQSHGPNAMFVFNTKNKINYGVNTGLSFIDGESYRITSPTLVFMINKDFKLFNKIEWTPELFSTFSNNYYSRDSKSWGTSLTCNAIVGNSLALKISKKFKLNVDWRMNMNTNPKFGLMNNILLGTKFDF